MNSPEHRSVYSHLSRRDVLRTAAGAAIGSAALSQAVAGDSAETGSPPAKDPMRQRIRQSIVHWCYKPFWPDVAGFCKVTKNLGCESVELIDPQHWPTLKEHGLTCAIAGSHGFKTGMNNPEHWDMCLAKMRERIDQSAAFGCPNVITFTGYETPEIDRETGLKNCVEGYKKIVGYAEEKGVTLCLEMLNTRDDTHPMKGHPGYQGDDVGYCIEILEKVGSPRLKLLFDIYHVQIMNGDVIRRIHQHKEHLGHIHTAGNPGRGELDDNQEINYPAVMKALLDVGYKGFVGQEFLCTGDPMKGLKQAVELCDV